jgi:hypothetical protein
VTLSGQDEDQKENETPTNDPPAQTPFEKFEEFARRVVSVPKKIVDEREREYQEERHNKRVPT